MGNGEREETLFWCSWVHTGGEDYRPLTFPPMTQQVLGWWCSGYDFEDRAILCAAVLAKDEAQAKRRIRKEWPEMNEWRFIEPKERTFQPNDRFPQSFWMKPRFKALLNERGRG